jgi:hypothetical protein
MARIAESISIRGKDGAVDPGGSAALNEPRCNARSPMQKLWWLCALLLAGCAPRVEPDLHAMPQGKYADYRAVLVEAGRATQMAEGTPDAVRSRFAECGADFILSGIAPLDRINLDHYARGELAMSTEELQRIDYVENTLHGTQPLTQGGLERLEPFCKADIPAFKQALGQ